MRTSTTAATLCCWLLMEPVNAGLYHWTDSHGRHHFSDTPHRDAKPYTPVTAIAPQAKPARLPSHAAPLEPKQGSIKSAPKPSSKRASTSKRAARCQGYANKLDAISIKLRRSHSNQQGNRWRGERRRYQALRWQHCR